MEEVIIKKLAVLVLQYVIPSHVFFQPADYETNYDKNISAGNGRFCRGFRGVHVKVRAKDVNY